jgi:hypothetical protein
MNVRRAFAVVSCASLALSVVSFSACGSGQGPGASSQDASTDGPGLDAGSPDASDGAPRCTQAFGPGDGGTAATIAVDPGKTVSTFVPQQLFGINAAYFIVAGDLLQTQPQVQAAGDTLIRYPGGSSSDDYHWNGAGQYDSSNWWVPSRTTYAPGFPGRELYRGTTSVAYGTPANVTDGDPMTTWLSNTDTDSPTAQWVYVDLGSVLTVTSLTIVWGTPYATSFQVQTSNSVAAYPPPYQGVSAQWLTTSAGTVTGTGGTQQVTFAPVQARYARILMSVSSAGVGGAYSIAELTAYNGTTQLTTNTPTNSQSPTTASSTDPGNVPTPQTNFDFESFMTYVSLFQPAALPLLTVNVGTGTPAEAAAWVHYANVVKGYGIRYWQIGNEMEGNWETGGPLDAQDYVRRYAEYYAAMKAEDPTITILGPVSGGIGEPSNLGDGRTFVQAFVEVLHQRGLDSNIGGIDFHWYPNYGPVTWSTALQTTSDLGTFASSLKGWLAETEAGASVPVFMSEYNLGLGPNNVPSVGGNQLLGGVWLASALGEYAKNFGPGGGTALWNLISNYTTSDSTDPTAGDLGYLQGNENAYRFQPHADYWAMQLLATDWAIAGDSRTHTLVSSTSSAPLLATYADLRPDGSLSLLVVNEDPANAYSTTISLGSFAPATAADVWTFDAKNYAWETTAAPYHAAPDLPPTYALTCGAAASTSFTFAPAGVTVIRFAGAGAPDAGVTTVPPADAGVTTVLIDDMSNPTAAEIQLAPLEPGGVSGYWYTYIGGGSGPSDTGSIIPLAQSEVDGGSAPFAYTALNDHAALDGGIAPPADAGAIAHAACARGETPAAQYAYAAEGFDFEDTPSSGPLFVDVSRFTGIQFWSYGALSVPSTIQVQIPDKESDPRGGLCGTPPDGSTAQACYQHVFIDLLVPPGWSFHRLPFAFFEATPGYGYPQPVGGDMAAAQGVHFQINQPNAPGAGGAPVAFDFCVAEIAFYE